MGIGRGRSRRELGKPRFLERAPAEEFKLAFRDEAGGFGEIIRLVPAACRLDIREVVAMTAHVRRSTPEDA
jgi:hypothetical protein